MAGHYFFPCHPSPHFLFLPPLSICIPRTPTPLLPSLLLASQVIHLLCKFRCTNVAHSRFQSSPLLQWGGRAGAHALRFISERTSAFGVESLGSIDLAHPCSRLPLPPASRTGSISLGLAAVRATDSPSLSKDVLPTRPTGQDAGRCRGTSTYLCIAYGMSNCPVHNRQATAAKRRRQGRVSRPVNQQANRRAFSVPGRGRPRGRKPTPVKQQDRPDLV